MEDQPKTREQQINELPDDLIAEAKRELESLEWFIALPTNVAEDEAIFDLALEMQETRRLQSAMNATSHLATLAEQMDATTDRILDTLDAGADQAVADVMAGLEAQVPVPELEEAERIKNARRRAA